MGERVHRFRRLGHEVQDSSRLLPEGHRVGFQRVDDIGERDGIPDEEYGQVVAHQVPVALFGVELHREAVRVTGSFRGVPSADDRGESDGERGLLPRDLSPLLLRFEGLFSPLRNARCAA